MLALDDFLDMVGHAFAALQHPRQGVRPRDERGGVAFEQFEEISLSRQQTLKPCEHPAYPCLVTHILHHVARLRDRAEPAVAERTDQRLQIGFVDRRCGIRSEEHTSELQSLMRISYAVFCLKHTNTNTHHTT